MSSACRIAAIVALLPAFAAGCSVTSTRIYGSDGKPYTYVDCNGPLQTLEDCYVAAREACPNGYRIVNGVAPRANPFGNLIVACNEPGAEAASAPAATTSPTTTEDL